MLLSNISYHQIMSKMLVNPTSKRRAAVALLLLLCIQHSFSSNRILVHAFELKPRQYTRTRQHNAYYDSSKTSYTTSNKHKNSSYSKNLFSSSSQTSSITPSSSLNLIGNKNNHRHTIHMAPSTYDIDFDTAETDLETDTSIDTATETDLETDTKTAANVNEKVILGVFYSAYLTLVSLLASTTNRLGTCYNSNNLLILHDVQCTIITTTLAFAFIKLLSSLHHKGILQSRDSRKLIHTLSAPLFMILWPFFNNGEGSRFFAIAVSLLQTLRLFLAGTTDSDQELSGAISRSGDKSEALKGPFIYTIVLFTTILFNWRNLSSIMTLSAMAAGDGVADLLGRRFGKNNKWFFNSSKSMAGSLAFCVATILCTIGMAFWFQYTGVILAFPNAFIPKVILISCLCAAVELVPAIDDNWSVPISAAVLSQLLF